MKASQLNLRVNYVMVTFCCKGNSGLFCYGTVSGCRRTKEKGDGIALYGSYFELFKPIDSNH